MPKHKPEVYNYYGHTGSSLLWWYDNGALVILRDTEALEKIKKAANDAGTPHKNPVNPRGVSPKYMKPTDIIHDDILGLDKSDEVYKGRIDPTRQIITMMVPVILFMMSKSTAPTRTAIMVAKKLARKYPSYDIAYYGGSDGQWINEMWYTNLPSGNHDDLILNPDTPVFINPTHKEWYESINSSSLNPKMLRILMDSKGNLYIWPAEAALHAGVRRLLRAKMNDYNEDYFMGIGDKSFNAGFFPPANPKKYRTAKSLAKNTTPFINISDNVRDIIK